MAQRDSKQEVRKTNVKPVTASVETPAVDRERIERALAAAKNPANAETMRKILEEYGETFDYLKDR
jgi:hypothetical protein